VNPDDPVWQEVADLYRTEREGQSFNSLLLDDRLSMWLPALESGNRRLLDYGAGTGACSVALASAGWHVTAVEPTPSMREQLESRLRGAGGAAIEVRESIDAASMADTFTAVLSMNVLDHVEDAAGMVRDLSTMAVMWGTVLISVPHPMKDLGDWVKRPTAAGWIYDSYRLTGYMKEGPCTKAREDSSGNVVSTVTSYHRRIETYFSMLRDAGLHVVGLIEPGPPAAAADMDAVLYTKCSRIPYFMVFQCLKAEAIEAP
jgi:SAM-dependent methyltransferase